MAFTIIGFSFSKTPEIASQVPNLGIDYVGITDEAVKTSANTSDGAGNGLTSQNTLDTLWMDAEFLIGVFKNIVMFVGVLTIPILILPSVFHVPVLWATGIQAMLSLVEFWTFIQVKAKMGTRVME